MVLEAKITICADLEQLSELYLPKSELGTTPGHVLVCICANRKEITLSVLEYRGTS